MLPNVAAQIGSIYQAVIGNAATEYRNDHVTACQQHRITSNIDRFGLTAFMMPPSIVSTTISIPYCCCTAFVLAGRVMTIERPSPTSKREAGCIADPRASFQTRRLSSCPLWRNRQIARPIRILHVRLIRGRGLLVRGTAEVARTNKNIQTHTNTTSTSTSFQSLTADLCAWWAPTLLSVSLALGGETGCQATRSKIFHPELLSLLDGIDDAPAITSLLERCQQHGQLT